MPCANGDVGKSLSRRRARRARAPLTLIALDVVTTNVVEPLLFSKRTGVSPLALLIAALFWTFG
jgi:hypothetical protein